MFVRGLQKPTSRRLAWWAAVASLAMTTHYFALFIVVPEGIWLLVATRKVRAMLANGVVFLTGLALLPLALEQRQRGHGGGLARAFSLESG